MWGMNAYPMMRVIWHDAFTSGLDWHHHGDQDAAPAEIVSVGYWLHDHPLDHHVTLAQSLAADGQVGELLHIPEPMVQDQQLLHSSHPPQRAWGIVSKLRRLRHTY